MMVMKGCSDDDEDDDGGDCSLMVLMYRMLCRMFS